MSEDISRTLGWNPALIQSLGAPDRIEVLSDGSRESHAVVDYLRSKSLQFHEVILPVLSESGPVLIFAEGGTSTRIEGSAEIAAFLEQRNL